ncbi:hypothetical protein OMR07_29040 [Methylobacterium organophilum]|nr:hypothetical protein [Methylobacterium organophilum]
MKPADEERDPTGRSDPVISPIHAQLAERLRQHYSEVAPIEIGSRLAALLIAGIAGFGLGLLVSARRA